MTKPTEGTKESSRRRCWWRRNWFYTVLISLAVIGVPSAFFVPPIIPGLTNDGNTVVSVRQGILAVLAGALTMLTLSETHRKNNQEKEKNENDHTRQVYAERRSRYTKAVEQLANEKAAVRLGGIYTLVGLADEWLADDSLTKDKQNEEGQVIINNLCSYIRSPFPLAEKIEEYEARKALENLQKTESEKLSEGKSSRLQVLLKRFEDSDEYEKPEDITADYAKFHEEQDVRRTIFVEMSKRSSIFTKNDKGAIIETVPGIWSDFDFDFSRAPIFYPLNAVTIEKGNFSSAKFYSNADFSGATFTQTANFSWATFTQNANFRRATFTQNANFHRAKFTQTTRFSWATFTQNADFSEATFTQNAHFGRVTFTQNAGFSEATFTQDAYFSGATFTQTANFSRAKFTQNARFSWAKFTQNARFSEATFTQTAYFHQVKFTETADFSKATFTQNAYFSWVTFTQNADFSKATFAQTAHFTRAIFTQTADFSEATFKETSPKFVDNNEGSDITFRARFAVLSDNQGEHEFTVREGSKLIEPGKATLRGKPFIIPVGTVLFDWDDELQGYITSEPAEPLDNSSTGEENITE